MQPRHTVLEMFSTLIGFEHDRFQQWLIEPALRRNLQRHDSSAMGVDPSPDFWVLYWHRIWRDNEPALAQSLALGHLIAFLQETGYWVAQRTARQLKGVQYGVADCFQLAIATIPSLLKSYSPTHGASLATYAGLCFGNALRDRLRQQQEVTSRSDWGLLRKASQKQIIEALQGAGLNPEQVTAHRLAWMAYKTCWAGPTAATRQLSAPDGATWEAIATFCNRQCGEDVPPVTAATAEQWLRATAQALRRLLHPAVVSLNVPKFDDGGEWQDDLPAVGETPWGQLIRQEEVQERRRQREQVGERLRGAIASLPDADQQLLRLYYDRHSTQQQIAEQLQIKQYTVSRRLSRVRDALLLDLAQWSQATLHISITSPVLKQMGLVLEEWLQQTFSKPTETTPQDRLLKA
ncbi:sigma-70 family RNA polymerase sigma factor [Leptolyngbya sp. CCNP1308]|uniref:sigma-70 family RNA polymerase sigma factor n=1 Tax=Leptolyngbya sp. CCNP1308 TaxID=3110255 RepID=UPI002B20CFFD|nr:sigma-70 family RNA polymerase sigma factor [Leptolyngbya sp. CCNP1308]MEA5449223.1 sigma-70 family RNA polymerase sigma factor [Leptolyngbya sp. CCNP1308]